MQRTSTYERPFTQEGNYLVSHVTLLIYCLSVQTREPKDEQLCIAVHLINNNIRDVDPLDNSSNTAQIDSNALHNMQPQ